MTIRNAECSNVDSEFDTVQRVEVKKVQLFDLISYKNVELKYKLDN